MGNCSCSDTPPTMGRSTLNLTELLNRNSIISKTVLTKANSISIRVLNWHKDSHNLFDFENKNITVQNINIDQPGYLARDANKGICYSSELTGSQDPIVRFIQHSNSLWINYRETPAEADSIDKTDGRPNREDMQLSSIAEDPCEDLAQPSRTEEQQNHRLTQPSQPLLKLQKIWVVVKSAQSIHNMRGIRLRPGDVIRLGRAKLTLTEYSDQPDKEVSQTRESIMSENNADETVCRTCLSSMESQDNPLINPCKCIGSMEYIHLQCLQQWHTTKNNMNGQDAIFFNWANMKCELCKSQIYRQFVCHGVTYDLVQLSKPKNGSYAIFDVKRKGSKRDIDTGISNQATYIVSFSKSKEIKIGRSTDSQMRICDISVSRFHAKLSLHEDGLFMSDNNSKFGSLVLLKYPIPLVQEINRLQVQVGRTVLEFNTSKNSSALQFSYTGFHKLM